MVTLGNLNSSEVIRSNKAFIAIRMAWWKKNELYFTLRKTSGKRHWKWWLVWNHSFAFQKLLGDLLVSSRSFSWGVSGKKNWEDKMDRQLHRACMRLFVMWVSLGKICPKSLSLRWWVVPTHPVKNVLKMCQLNRWKDCEGSSWMANQLFNQCLGALFLGSFWRFVMDYTMVKPPSNHHLG